MEDFSISEILREQRRKYANHYNRPNWGLAWCMTAMGFIVASGAKSPNYWLAAIFGIIWLGICAWAWLTDYRSAKERLRKRGVPQ